MNPKLKNMKTFELTPKQLTDCCQVISSLFNDLPDTMDAGTIRAMFEAYLIGEGINSLTDPDDVDFVAQWIDNCNNMAINPVNAERHFDAMNDEIIERQRSGDY